MQYSWALEFPNSNVCSTIGPGNFLITKKCADNNLSIYLLISNSHGSSMYTLSMGIYKLVTSTTFNNQSIFNLVVLLDAGGPSPSLAHIPALVAYMQVQCRQKVLPPPPLFKH